MTTEPYVYNYTILTQLAEASEKLWSTSYEQSRMFLSELEREEFDRLTQLEGDMYQRGRNAAEESVKFPYMQWPEEYRNLHFDKLKIEQLIERANLVITPLERFTPKALGHDTVAQKSLRDAIGPDVVRAAYTAVETLTEYFDMDGLNAARGEKDQAMRRRQGRSNSQFSKVKEQVYREWREDCEAARNRIENEAWADPEYQKAMERRAELEKLGASRQSVAVKDCAEDVREFLEQLRFMEEESVIEPQHKNNWPPARS